MIILILIFFGFVYFGPGLYSVNNRAENEMRFIEINESMQEYLRKKLEIQNRKIIQVAPTEEIEVLTPEEVNEVLTAIERQKQKQSC